MSCAGAGGKYDPSAPERAIRAIHSFWFLLGGCAVNGPANLRPEAFLLAAIDQYPGPQACVDSNEQDCFKAGGNRCRDRTGSFYSLAAASGSSQPLLWSRLRRLLLSRLLPLIRYLALVQYLERSTAVLLSSTEDILGQTSRSGYLAMATPFWPSRTLTHRTPPMASANLVTAGGYGSANHTTSRRR